jgi:hypothetical protein
MEATETSVLETVLAKLMAIPSSETSAQRMVKKRMERVILDSVIIPSSS